MIHLYGLFFCECFSKDPFEIVCLIGNGFLAGILLLLFNSFFFCTKAEELVFAFFLCTDIVFLFKLPFCAKLVSQVIHLHRWFFFSFTNTMCRFKYDSQSGHYKLSIYVFLMKDQLALVGLLSSGMHHL